ncbi:MAG: AAA family ATPase, partial [Nitrospiraceae bacterium]|nr:AAA family ATPase [Nitrospiraceae bacterium]
MTSVPIPDMPMVPSDGFVFDPKRFLWLRGPMMLAIALCVGIPAAIAAWFLVPANYTATAEMRFLSDEPYVLSANKGALPYQQFVSTQTSLITGTTVLSRVLDSPEIRSIPSLAAASSPLAFLRKRIRANSRRGSEIVIVTCSMQEKDGALRVLEEVVEVYLNFVLGEQASRGMDRLAMLTQERAVRQLELEAQLTKIREMHRAMGIPLVGETPLDTGEARLYKEKYVQAQEDLAKAQRVLGESERRIASLENLVDNLSKGTPLYDFGIEERVSADIRVSALRGQVVMIQASLAGTEQTQRENLPHRQNTEKELKSLREHLASVQLEVRREVLESMRTTQTEQLGMIQNELEDAQERVNKFKQLVDEYDLSLSATTNQYVELNNLKSKAAETRTMLAQVSSSIATINVESNAPARMALAAPATASGSRPDYTNRLMVTAIALAASVGLALALGLWRELADQEVRSSLDLSRMTPLPVIAAIPHADEDSLPDSADLALLTEQAPLSALADAYRCVLARVLNPDREPGEMRSLAVVSPAPGDGKSSLTTNLGIALARARRRVLIVDLSYRRPTLESYFHSSNEEGLAEILNGKITWDQVIRSTHVDGLSVLGPGFDTGDLVGRIPSQVMVKFLEQAAAQFDHVILDTTPWLIMADARLVTPLVGSVLVVVGSGTSTLGMVRRCLRELIEVKANVVGVVFNRARSTAGGYMKKNRELYYSYSNAADVDSREAMPAVAGVGG